MPLHEPIRLFGVDKILHHVGDYPCAPPLRKARCESLRFSEQIVERLRKNLGTLVVVRLCFPLVANPVEPLEIHWAAAHRAGGTRCTLVVPRLYTILAENVTAAQFLEGASFRIADGTLEGGHFGLVWFLTKTQDVWLGQDTFFTSRGRDPSQLHFYYIQG